MIAKTIIELNKIFKILNVKFFEDKLIEPVILIQGRVKKHTMGTCSCNPIWQKQNLEENKKYEITLSGKYLNRSLEETVGTLIHEMVHLYCSLNEIKDPSNNCVYHNKKFKEEAEKRGLNIERAKTIGWSVTTLTDPTKAFVKTLNIDKKAFEYWRNAIEIKSDKPKVILNKYKCPCGVKVTSTKELNIICGDCDKKFEKVDMKLLEHNNN